MKHLLFLLMIFILGCQSQGGGSEDLFENHAPVDNEFTLTTTMNHTYATSEVINLVLSFPKAVVVSGGTPSIVITIGSTTRTAVYTSGSSSENLIFSYTVVGADLDTDGIQVSSVLDKNGATIVYNSSAETSTVVDVPDLSSVRVGTAAGAPPVASNISPLAFNEDTQSGVITLAYTDADSDQATSCTLSSLNKVTVTQACACAAGVCTVRVTGTANSNGAASFNYIVNANGQNSNSALASFTITPVADIPVAKNITPAAFNEDTQSLITLSYTDGDGDLATICAISSPTNVTVTQACACAAGVCTVGVTGTANYNGAASFNYTVTANAQVSNSALATFSITAVGDAPVASNITPAAFNEDIQSIITLSYVDVDSVATTCTISGPTSVTVTQPCACAAGVCSVGVTGTTNFNGGASFNYTVTANGQTSNSAIATLTIAAVDDAPVATNSNPAAFPANTQSIITLSYTDVESHPAALCSITSPTNVTITQACACTAGVCTVGVTGTSNYKGAASFNYTVTANTLVSNLALASLTINGTAPVASNITPAAFNEDTQGLITLSYTDGEADLATVCVVSGLTSVTVTQPCACAAGICTVGVTGPLNYNGAASFTYKVTADSQISNSATAILSITSVDDAPAATNITPAAFLANTQSVITLSYTDVESHLATSCSISSPTNVTETQACACAAGVCTVGVTGTSNYKGAASFNYTVTANTLVSNSALATLTINGTAPVASNFTPAAFNEDTQGLITLSYTDAESDQATVCTVSGLTSVTVTQACACAAGVCTVGVSGAANYFGAASFTYTVTADSQISNSATATLSITSVDDAPVAANITPPSFNQGAQSIITLSYTDVESDQATSCSLSALTNVTETQACACAAGICTVGVSGSPIYFGAASFQYTVTNGLTSNSALASLTIISANQAPVATNMTPASFNEDTQSIITLAYTDTESDPATVCALSSLSGVTATQACACAAGICTVGVTGTANFNGAASFNFTVTANGQVSNAASATFTIDPVADAPVAINLTPAAFNEDVASTITLSYTDVEGDFASSCSISGLTNVTVTTACSCTLGTCTVGVRGSTNYFGTASFSYTVNANTQNSNSATASLTVSSVEDAAIAANITPTAFNEDTQSIITLSYTDVDSQSTSCAITPSNVTVTQTCACTAGICTVGVTGTANYNGGASFTYTVSSNSVTSNSANATFTINSVNDVPTIGTIGTQTTNVNTPTAGIAFTIADADHAVACTGTNLSMTSSNTAVVANASVVWSGTAPNCSAVITPVTNSVGTTSITFTVNDNAGGTVNRVFTLNVNGAILIWTTTGGATITTYDFGTPGANTSVNVLVKNVGNVTSGTVTVTDNNESNRIDHTGTCTTISVGATCPITITWNNTGGGGVRNETFTASAPSAVPSTLSVTGIK